MKDKVSISTLDVRFTAGTSTVTEFTYQMLIDAGYDPHLIFNAIPWDECVTISDLFRRNPLPDVKTGEFSGMEGCKIERVLPEFAIFNYILNYRPWSQCLDSASKHLVVGGTCIHGLPVAFKGEPFVCWIGTTFEDQHKLQLDSFATHRRIRNKFALPFQKRYERYVLRSADVVLVQSNYTKSKVTESVGIDEDRVEVLPFPIDTSQYSPKGPINDNEILFVGRINAPRKNTELLLKSFSQVLTDVPDAELTLVGDQPDQELRSLITSLGIESAVNLEGRVPDVIPYYRRASVFALPSNQEGLGIVGLEAQSCGTPVVSTKCGGPEDYVVDGENGFLVPLGDVDSFASSLTTVLTDKKLRESFRSRSRDMVVSNYDMDEIRSRLQAYVDEL